MPIDYSKPEGQVRLLIPDTDESNLIFEDSQIAGYIQMARDNNLKRAAALAVDAIATSEALISKVIRTQDLSTNGAAVANALREHAKNLRQQADEDDDNDGSSFFFDYVPFDPYGKGPELTEGYL